MRNSLVIGGWLIIVIGAIGFAIAAATERGSVSGGTIALAAGALLMAGVATANYVKRQRAE